MKKTNPKEKNEDFFIITNIAKEVLSDYNFSIYIIGSIAYGDFIKGVSDIDFMLIFEEELNENIFSAIKKFVKILKESTDTKFDAVFLSENQVDIGKNQENKVIYYNDAMLRYDNNCGNISPVNWLELKTIGIKLCGKDISLNINTTIDDVLDYAYENINSYWVNCSHKLADLNFILTEEEVAWCVLGISRLIYVIENKKLCSKTVAGLYAKERFGNQYEDIIDSALLVRQNKPIIIDSSYKEKISSYLNMCINIYNVKYNKIESL